MTESPEPQAPSPKPSHDYHGYCYKHKGDIWWSEECQECKQYKNKPPVLTPNSALPTPNFSPGCMNTLFLARKKVVETDGPGGIKMKEEIYIRDDKGEIIRDEKQVPVELVRVERVKTAPEIAKSRYGYKYACPKCGYEFSPAVFESVWDRQYNDDTGKTEGVVFCPLCERPVPVERVKIIKNWKGRLKKLKEIFFGKKVQQ